MITSGRKRGIVRIMKKFCRILKYSILLWLIYFVICLVIPPLYHKPPTEEAEANGIDGNIFAQERIRSIDNNMDALLWRLRLIESAKERIVLVTFDLRDDNSGRDIMAALLHAADRGVQVQILVDGINGTLYLKNSNYFQELTAHENVEAKLYNPVDVIKPWKNNYRMHDKYLIADDFAYILGGRNTNDLFLGNYADSYNEDRDILVYETSPGEGKSYCQLQDYFEKIWNLSCNRAYGLKNNPGNNLREHYGEVCETYPAVLSEPDWNRETSETESIMLYTNPMEPENKSPQLWQRMLQEMKQADDIMIQTPYMICSRQMYQDLTEVCSKAGKTEVMINAVEKGSNPFGCTDYLNQKKNVSKTGCSVYEYLGPQALHTKTILVDDHLSMVGSCNLDMRSIYLDTEMMLFIESKDLNQELRSQIESLKRSSRQVLPDGTVTDGDHYREMELSVGKQIVYGLLRIVIIPIRHLL